MATNAPLAPTLNKDDTSRTLTGFDLTFVPNADNGGSPISGYKLWRDEGISGSPFSLVYDGTSRPEQIEYVAKGLTTGYLYSY